MNAQRVIRAVKTPVTLLALLSFVVVSGMWGLDALRAPIPPRPPDPCVVQQIGPELTPEYVYVQVYNGSEVNGLAKRLASILRADGFNVLKTANTETPDHETSEVVGYAEDSPEVVLVRQAFQDIPFRADGRPDRTVDVIIGAQRPVPLDAPVLSVPLPDGTACLPQVQKVGAAG